MALTIQTNMAALEAQRQLGISNKSMSQALERLSSGFRINSAADDAAGNSMSNTFVAQISAMNVAQTNVSQANSLFQIAEGGMSQISQILDRLKELATEASSANTASSDLPDISAEAQALQSEIDRIANSTTFQGTALINGTFGAVGAQNVTNTSAGALNLGTIGGTYNWQTGNAQAAVYSVSYTAGSVFTIKDMTTSVAQTVSVSCSAGTVNFTALNISFGQSAVAVASTFAASVASTLDGGGGGFILSGSGGSGNTFQVGETNSVNYQISFSIGGATTALLCVDTTKVILGNQTDAQSSMGYIDNAIATLNLNDAGVGAAMNRLGYAASNLSVGIENASAANSAVKDVDMASEMTTFTKNQVLVQAGTAMLAQANASAQNILTLFK